MEVSMRHTNKLLAALAMMVAAAVLYGAAYLWLVRVNESAFFFDPVPFGVKHYPPAYIVGGKSAYNERLTFFFAPAHAIDLRLWPQRWEIPPEVEIELPDFSSGSSPAAP
jgi:hypothetical protein